jgi:hypothetical protein
MISLPSAAARSRSRATRASGATAVVAAAGLLWPAHVPGAPAQDSPCDTVAADARESEDAGVVLEHDLGGGCWLCLRADPGVQLDPADGSILELPAGRSLAVAILERGSSRTLRATGEDAGPRYDWRVGGEPKPFEGPAREWLADALEAAAGLRAIAATRTEAARLQREIEAARESEARLRDEIGAILAERSRLEQQIGSARSEERELREAIGAVQGEETALRVALGAQRTAIASLTAQLDEADLAAREEIEGELAGRRDAVARLEAQLREQDHASRIAALEARLKDQGTEQRVAAIEAQIAELGVDERIAELERQSQSQQARERVAALRRRLNSLDPDTRIARVERRLAPVLRRLASRSGGP